MCNYSEAIWMEGAYQTVLDLVRKKLISINHGQQLLMPHNIFFCFSE